MISLYTLLYLQHTCTCVYTYTHTYCCLSLYVSLFIRSINLPLENQQPQHRNLPLSGCCLNNVNGMSRRCCYCCCCICCFFCLSQEESKKLQRYFLMKSQALWDRNFSKLCTYVCMYAFLCAMVFVSGKQECLGKTSKLWQIEKSVLLKIRKESKANFHLQVFLNMSVSASETDLSLKMRFATTTAVKCKQNNK